MYILINTETAEVKKFETIDDLLMGCMKSNGVLHSLKMVAEAAVEKGNTYEKEGFASVSPSEHVIEEHGIGTTLASNEASVSAGAGGRTTPHYINPFNQSSNHRVEWSALDMARSLSGTEAEKIIETTGVKDKVEGEEIFDADDRVINKLDALTRYKELNTRLETEKKAPKMLDDELKQIVYMYYDNEFVKYHTKGTTTKLEKTNYAMYAWRLFLNFPQEFGTQGMKEYKNIFASDTKRWNGIHLERNSNSLMPILNPNSPAFKEFFSIASTLEDTLGKQDDLASFMLIGEVVYNSFKAIYTNEINIEFIEKWIKLFLQNKTKSAQGDSIKSSTLYDAFFECMDEILNVSISSSRSRDIYKMIEENISQKTFTRILKTTFGWKNQRKSDGIYWLSVAFGQGTAGRGENPQISAALPQGSLLEGVEYYDEGNQFAYIENINPGIPPTATRSSIHDYSIQNPLKIPGDGEKEEDRLGPIENETLGSLRKKSHGAALLRTFSEKDFA